MTEALFIIDPQKDFIDNPKFMGALAVKGAHEDMQRLAHYIKTHTIDSIFVTLDTHEKMDIAHALWWVNSKGENPPPFTLITVQDIENKIWQSSVPDMQSYSEFYVRQLAKNNKYQLCIWPDHCIKNTKGHEIDDDLKATLNAWEQQTDKKVNYIVKGDNPKTEHYSGLKAEVVLDEENTHLRLDVIQSLDKYEKITLAGEASSHCTGSTGRDLLENLSVESRKKVTYLIDCMSPVSGFEENAIDFLNKAQNMGAVLEYSQKPTLKNKM